MMWDLEKVMWMCLSMTQNTNTNVCYIHMHSEHMLPVITAYVITVSTVFSIAIVSLAASSLNKRHTLSQKIFLYMSVCIYMYMTMTLHSQNSMVSHCAQTPRNIWV